ncbi:MAG: PQQ-binding-like beta-propeller repeat protein [Alphaproteobacteria bacterium]|nr:PQQ-binding-like beta-propeller repeat protein [Alphaproteobacteria bacterium]
MTMRPRFTSLRFNFIVCLGLLLVVSACGSDEATKDRGIASSESGKRIAVLEAARRPTADTSLSGYAFEIPEPAVIESWAQNGGNTEHAVGNPFLSAVPEKIWSSSIGSGSNSDFKLLSSPVVDGNVVYAMDARGRVSAYASEDGERLWQMETAPQKSEGDAMGGGVAVQGGVVYATTGFGEILALNALDGSVKWRRLIGNPLRSAPTVAEGRVFAITIENETYALDGKTGNVMWRHSGIAENATLMGSSSPAVHGATVVVAYSSGEVFGLRAQNGRVVWGEVLAIPTQIGALPAIADIRGLPVMDLGRVYVVSHSGRMASIDERSGERAWEADLGGVNTPAVVGNAVYLLTLDNELIALSRSTGRIIWVRELQRYKDPDDRESRPVLWSGPVMAGGRLWLTNSLGDLVAYAPETGFAMYDENVAGSFYLPPIVAKNTMYLMDDNGTLLAFK